MSSPRKRPLSIYDHLQNAKPAVKKPKVEKKVETDKFAQCPVCGRGVLIDRINEHLDACGARRSSSPSNDQQEFDIDKCLQKQNETIVLDSPILSSPQRPPSNLPVLSSPICSVQEKPKQQNTNKGNPRLPLAERVRPNAIEEVIGQEHILGEGGLLRKLLEQKTLPSLIFWGPPGTGKTTLGRLLAQHVKYHFVQLSATNSGTADVKKVIETAKNHFLLAGQQTALFIDEIHRFNKSQQDTFLPCVERGDIVLIGATTENPSFEVNSALLSRCRVLVLSKLSSVHIKQILDRAIKNEQINNVNEEAIEYLSEVCDGDARIALNCLELTAQTSDSITFEKIKETIKQTHLLYDKKGDEHFNCISALHKSLRGSDIQAAVYWGCRMLQSGDDPLYVCRRLIRFASEDVGLADPNALLQAMAATEATRMLGMPECTVNILQCVCYLAMAPKSNALDKAFNSANEMIKKTGALPVPLHIRNPSTKLMKNLGYGDGYIYNPEYEDDDPLVLAQKYLPEEIKDSKFVELSKVKYPVVWPSFRFYDQNTGKQTVEEEKNNDEKNCDENNKNESCINQKTVIESKSEEANATKGLCPVQRRYLEKKNSTKKFTSSQELAEYALGKTDHSDEVHSEPINTKSEFQITLRPVVALPTKAELFSYAKK